MANLQSAVGIFALLALPGIVSAGRRGVAWRQAAVALLVTFPTAGLLLKVPPVARAFGAINNAVDAVSAASRAGTSFVFGYLGGGQLPYELKVPGAEFVLALQALPILLVMSVLTTLLFHWRILPPLVHGFSWLLERTLKVGGAVGLSTAANIFLGMVEAPLFIRPYLASLTRSELFIVMTGGMAGIAGTVLVIYATLLGPLIPDAAAHFVIASVMGAPAAILVSLIMVPELIDQRTGGERVEVAKVASSTMDAIVRGTAAGLELLLNICAMLIVLVALVHLANAIIGLLPAVAGAPITLQRLLGYLMAPVCWLMGVPWNDHPQRVHRLCGALEATPRRARSTLAADPALRHVWFRQFRLARHHDRGARHHGAGAARRRALARRQVDRVGDDRDLPDGRDRGHADLSAARDRQGSVQTEFVVDGADFGRPDQAGMRDRDRVQRSLERLQPEGEKPVEHRKSRTEVVVLPDIGLQQRG